MKKVEKNGFVLAVSGTANQVVLYSPADGSGTTE